MIRPPSLQRQRTDFYSGDPAFVPAPKLEPKLEGLPTPEELAAHRKALEEHERRWEVARETGDYSELLVSGCEPTPFTMRQIPGATFRKLADDHNAGTLRLLELSQVAFRCSVVDIPGLAQKVKRNDRHPLYGEMATVEITNYLDSIDHGIVSELGRVALNRAGNPSPKS